MPTIHFDVLVPATEATTVRETFQNALDILADKDKIASGSVTMHDAPDVDDAVVQQLHANYRNDHDGAELADAAVHRYSIVVEGAVSSYNQLAMGLSRVLTPAATLPNDPLAEISREADFEMPATYPWTVEIRR
ncbi:hypothetical protein [Corynebacterium sp.]|uniref:hypothetical protein n=1 Tax=Corynebacterium sp. TaxID=1720 RepID=UPI0037366D43